MSNIISIENGTTLRNKYLEVIALTLRSLVKKVGMDEEVRDMIAFIVIVLGKINKSIETTTSAWEKRDYWLKADQFRSEWMWSEIAHVGLSKALNDNDWDIVVNNLPPLIKRCAGIKIKKKIISTTPWIGSYQLFLKELR